MNDVLAQCTDLPRRTFRAGEAIMTEGGQGGLLFILIEGEVEVLKGDFQVASVDTPGAFFGDVSVLLDQPHMATVRAVSDATLHVTDDPVAFLTAKPLLALSLARLLAKRLHSVTTYLVDLKHQFEDHDSHLSMVDEVLEALVHHQAKPSTPGSQRCPDVDID